MAVVAQIVPMFSRQAVPGQVPRKFRELQDTLRPAPPMTEDRLLWDRPVHGAGDVARGLALGDQAEARWTEWITQNVGTQPNELRFRQALGAQLYHSTVPNTQRKAMMMRAINYYRFARGDTMKAIVMRPEEVIAIQAGDSIGYLEKAGVRYYRRVETSKGPKYVFDQAYSRRKDGDTGDGDIQAAIEKIPDDGAEPSSMASLVKKYGSRNLATALKRAGCCIKNGRIYKAKGGMAQPGPSPQKAPKPTATPQARIIKPKNDKSPSLRPGAKQNDPKAAKQARAARNAAKSERFIIQLDELEKAKKKKVPEAQLGLFTPKPVIAVGPRGGQITGYADGKPVYGGKQATGSGIAAASDPEPKKKSADEEKVLEAARALRHDAHEHVLISIRDVRRHLGWEKERFDNAVLSLGKRGSVSLHHHDHPSGLPIDQRNDLVMGPEYKDPLWHDKPARNYYVGFVIEEPAPQKEPRDIAAGILGGKLGQILRGGEWKIAPAMPGEKAGPATEMVGILSGAKAQQLLDAGVKLVRVSKENDPTKPATSFKITVPKKGEPNPPPAAKESESSRSNRLYSAMLESEFRPGQLSDFTIELLLKINQNLTQASRTLANKFAEYNRKGDVREALAFSRQWGINPANKGAKRVEQEIRAFIDAKAQERNPPPRTVEPTVPTPEPPPAPTPVIPLHQEPESNTSKAKRAIEAARKVAEKEGVVGRAFIMDVMRETGLTKEELLGLHQAGLLELHRLDLVPVAHNEGKAHKIDPSEIRHLNATFHLVEPNLPEPWQKPQLEAPALGGDPEKLERVGDHIWGSRKDLAQLGEITSSKQLESMSTDDAALIVRKSKLIPAMSLKEMRAMGMSPGTAHMVTAFLASIVAQPPDSKAARAEYVDRVRELMGAVKDLKTLDQFSELLSEIREVRSRAPKWEPVDRLPMTDGGKRQVEERIRALERDNPGVEFRYAMKYGDYSYEIVKKAARPYDSLGARFATFITHKGKFFEQAYVVANTADGLWSYSNEPRLTREQGWALLEASTKEKKKQTRAKPPVMPKGTTERGHSTAKQEAKTVRRTGGIQIKDANPERARSTFGFREVDFGEYLSQADREYHVKALEEAMHDLSEVLGLEKRHISMNGRVGVALGARGRGKAKAHYEPGRKAINITKFRGGGSVAHEWGHALDNIVAEHYVPTNEGTVGTVFLSKRSEHSAIPSELGTAVRGVMDAMMKHPDPVEAHRKHSEKQKAALATESKLVSENNTLVREHGKLQAKPKVENAEKVIAAHKRAIENSQARIKRLTELNQKRRSEKREIEIGHNKFWIEQAEKKIAELTGGTGHQTDADRARMKEIEARIEELRGPINRAREDLSKLNKMKPDRSDYLAASIEGGEYLSRTEEMWARAFESYVADRLEDGKRENSYLVDSDKLSAVHYPQGGEREAINAAFDHLMEVIRNGGHLAKSLAALDRPRFILRKAVA